MLLIWIESHEFKQHSGVINRRVRVEFLGFLRVEVSEHGGEALSSRSIPAARLASLDVHVLDRAAGEEWVARFKHRLAYTLHELLAGNELVDVGMVLVPGVMTSREPILGSREDRERSDIIRRRHVPGYDFVANQKLFGALTHRVFQG
jgi:hypothetical protein